MADTRATPRARREHGILTVIVIAGFAARAVTIWIGQPEFVGWFNHSYYYWVQTKGLLFNGALPFADLPLTFYLYAGVAKGLSLFGVGTSTAIVNTSRAIMSLVPALIAIPVYKLLKHINAGQSLLRWQWVFVSLSAFLPLTLIHTPELLQKNTIGFLLLATLMYTTYCFLQTRAISALIGSLFFFGLIAITHIGTLAVALLFGGAMALGVIVQQRTPRQVIGWLSLIVAGFGVGLITVNLLDAGAFARVLRYAQTSLPSSPVGNLFASEPQIGRLMAALAIVIPAVVFLLLLRDYRRHGKSLSSTDRVFWLGNTIFAYLLTLPIFDLDLLPRFVLFLPIPAIPILIYSLNHVQKAWLRTMLSVIASMGVAVMVFGEIMSQVRLSPNRETVHQELIDLSEQLTLTNRDFILTRYGVNPICNWFLGTRSGLITAFSKDDIAQYDRLFVLNPADGGMPSQRPDNSPRDVGSGENEAYLITRQNVPLPSGLMPIVETGHFTLYQIEVLPSTWRFDDNGHWIGSVSE